MASRARRARVVLGVIAVALVGLGVWAWEPVYWWVMTERVYQEMQFEDGTVLRGWYHVWRWSETLHGPRVTWYTATGYNAHESLVAGYGRTSHWASDGAVRFQSHGLETGFLVYTEAPPWLWGVTDQTSPTMPEWMKDDAQWQAALDAQE